MSACVFVLSRVASLSRYDETVGATYDEYMYRYAFRVVIEYSMFGGVLL